MVLQCLCVALCSTIEAQNLDNDLLQQLPALSNALPFFNSAIGQQLLQGLQSLSSQQYQQHGSQLQDYNAPSQQNYAGSQQQLNGRPKFGGQNGGFQQGSEGRPPNSYFIGPPNPPFNDQQGRPGSGNVQQQQQSFNRRPPPQQQQQAFGVQQAERPVQNYQQGYGFNVEHHNTQGNRQSISHDVHSGDNDQRQFEYQQYNHFHQVDHNDDHGEYEDHEAESGNHDHDAEKHNEREDHSDEHYDHSEEDSDEHYDHSEYDSEEHFDHSEEDSGEHYDHSEEHSDDHENHSEDGNDDHDGHNQEGSDNLTDHSQDHIEQQ